MGALFSPDLPEAKPQPAPPEREDPEIAAAAERELALRRKTTSRAASLLTGGEGVTEALPVATKALLGQ